MIKHLSFTKMVLTAVTLCFTSIFAAAYDGHEPLQAFINREKSEHSFIEVSNLWAKDNSFPKSKATPFVKDASFFTLDFNNLNQFISNNNRCINLLIPNPSGGNFVVELAQYASVTGSFSVDGDDGVKRTTIDYTHGLHYRGVVNGQPGSIAAFSFFNNQVYGIFSIPGVGNFSIVPNTLVSKIIGDEHYILYNDADLLIAPEGPGCSTDALPALPEAFKSANAQAKNAFNSCKEIKIYVRADYKTYTDIGSNVSSVANYITSVFNVISAIYRNEGIYVALHKVVVNTATDQYQSLSTNSSSNFLNKFGQVTQNNMEGADLAMLYSTRGGNMGGVAWLDVLCENYSSWNNNHFGPYAFMNINTSTPLNFPNYSWNTSATSHEIGHNIGSPHTHRCSWSATGGGNNAIDGCYSQEDGPCSLLGPQYPSAGGTIMSYCHLVQGIGVNLSNGFGTAPGNLIRAKVNQASCPVIYIPNIPQTSFASNANRECTDPHGFTYYWYDGVNADTSGDRIVLKIKKGNNNIGDIDQTGFIVKGGALSGYGNGTGIPFSLPAGIPGYFVDTNIAMRRYWTVTPTTQPTTPVDVYVPYTTTDLSDMDGSVPGAPVTEPYVSFYNVANTSVNPSPQVLNGVTASTMKIYSYNATTTSATTWKPSPSGSTKYAQFPTAYLGGGTGFINFIHPLSAVGTINKSNIIAVYPNPFTNNWSIDVPKGDNITLQVYATDGKVVQTQTLNGGQMNTINGSALPVGMYFYRVISATETYTGSIIKE